MSKMSTFEEPRKAAMFLTSPQWIFEFIIFNGIHQTKYFIIVLTNKIERKSLTEVRKIK